MKRLFIVALIAVAMLGLFVANQALLLAKSPETAGDAMSIANQLYEAGQYAQAAQAYQQLVNQGYGDGALFYNLGNAHFKQGDYGRAILNYRRAQQLAPRDPDIETNLALARAQVYRPPSSSCISPNMDSEAPVSFQSSTVKLNTISISPAGIRRGYFANA